MTRLEAIEEMKKGNRITHRYFTDDEWVSSNKYGDIYTLEDGVQCTKHEFWRWRSSISWSDGYEIFKPKNI